MLKRIIKRVLKGIVISIAALILIACSLLVWMLYLSPLKPYDEARYPAFMGLWLPMIEMSYSNRRFNPDDIYTFNARVSYMGI